MIHRRYRTAYTWIRIVAASHSTGDFGYEHQFTVESDSSSNFCICPLGGRLLGNARGTRVALIALCCTALYSTEKPLATATAAAGGRGRVGSATRVVGGFCKFAMGMFKLHSTGSLGGFEIRLKAEISRGKKKNLRLSFFHCYAHRALQPRIKMHISNSSPPGISQAEA